MPIAKDPYGTVEDEATRQARLAAMARAAGTTWSGSDQNADRPDMGTVLSTTPTPTSSWSGSDQNPTNSSFAPSSDQLAAMKRAIADTAAKNAAAKTPTGYVPTSGWSGSDMNTTTPPTGSAGGSTGQSGSDALQRAATGGSLPGTSTIQQPTTVPTIDTGPNALNKAYTDASAGTNAAMLAASGAGTTAGAGASGAGTSSLQGQSGAGSSSLGGGGDLGALTQSILGQLQGIGQSIVAPGNAPDVQGVFMQQAQSILKMLDDQEAQLRAESEKNGTTIDPATAFTIDKIREGLEENLKTTREDLNRRGLYDSGIAADAEIKLRKGSASDQAMVLSSRLSKLQDELTKGLSSIRSQKVNTLQDFGGRAANAQFTSDENTRRMAYDKEQNALRAMLDLRSQQSGEANSAANRSFQSEQSALDRSFQSNESELERAYGQAQNQAKTAAEFEQNRLAYEREKSLIAQRSSSGAYGGGGTTKTTTKTSAQDPNEPNANTWSAINDLMNTFGTSAEAIRAINEQQDELVANGVDLSRMYDAASKIAGTDRRRS